MSLLDDVSIVVTPNGYKAGTLFAVKPTDVLGAEEVTNGDFANGLTGWTENGGSYATIVSGALNSNNPDAGNWYAENISQNVSFVNGNTYKLTFKAKNISGNLNLRITQGANAMATLDLTSTFVDYTYFYTANADNGSIRIFCNSAVGQFQIDDISIKEYTAADMDVTRATAATRVDENGLVNYAEVVSDTELVTNGDFDTDTDWTKGAGWTISGGNLNASNVNAVSTTQAGYTFVGKTFQVSYTISDYSQGSVQIYLGGSQSTSLKSENGTHTETISISSGNTTLYIYGTSNFTGSIDNISVKEVTRDNVPRIDYTGGGCPHILAEPQRTNNIQYSEDFTQSYWRKDKVTVTANSIISPSGQLNASLIQETVYTGGIPSFDLLSSITLSAGTYTYTFYVKNNNGRYLGISFGSNAQRVRTNFDFTTNTFKTLIFNGTTTGSASFTTLGDYYRISITATFPSSTAADTVLMPLATDTYPFYAFQDSDNRSFYLWGAQLEAGSYATSYIPTSGSTVTRNQDIFTRDGIGSLINSTEGVLFAEIAALANDVTNRSICLSDGTSVNRILFRYEGSNIIRAFVLSGGTIYVNFTFTHNNINNLKFAIKWKVNDFAFWVNGNEVLTDASGNAPIGLNRLALDNGSGTQDFYGKVKQLQVYKTALTDTQLAALTS